jgi:hypothetical protein
MKRFAWIALTAGWLAACTPARTSSGQDGSAAATDGAPDVAGQGGADTSSTGGSASGGATGAGGVVGTGGTPVADGGGADQTGSDGAVCSDRHLRWGANIHDCGGDPQKLAAVMADRRLTTARMDLWANDDAYLTRFRNAVAQLVARGITVEAILYNRYSAGQPQSQTCATDLSIVEQSSYEQTLPVIRGIGDLVLDFELQNEISLYENIKTAGTTGQIASDYNVACALMQAANLRGMSRAVVAERTRTGLPLRIILGTTDRSFGFLTFMEQKNVTFDVVGYHIYPWESHPPLDQDPWFGAGGPLGQLARFGRPIHINEFNCGETYSGAGDYADRAGYENQAGRPVTEACLRSLAKHLKELVTQTVANVESVHFYEMWDEPAKAAPENRFGLMTDLGTPKVHMYLAAAFSGGTLSSTEESELTSRGLLTAAQIANWRSCGAAP